MGKKQLSGIPDFTWSFKIELNTTRKVIFFDSPSHEISMISQNQQSTETVFVMSKQCQPNQDFSFLYTTQDFHLPSHVVGKTDCSATVMLSLIPKFCTLNINDAYRASVENKPYETDVSSAKGQYIFLLDRSGSMGGARIKKAIQALVFFLKSLPEDSYFNVISFGTRNQHMFGSSQRYNVGKVTQAIKTIETMTANLGGTQIYTPLSSLLNAKIIAGYPKHIFLLTDGGVSNTDKVIKLVQKNTKYTRVHSIGIGNGASFALIQGCAAAGKGKSTMISDQQNPADKIIELLETTLTPLITQVSLKYDQKTIQSIVPNPDSVPYILKDDIVNFYVTFKEPLTQQAQFKFQYIDSVTKLPYSTDFVITPESSNHPYVDKMAHLKVLRSLQKAADEGIQIEQQMFYAKIKDYKNQAIRYSVKHQVLSTYTSFICVGKQLVDGQYQQYLGKGLQKVQIQQIKPIEYQKDDYLDLNCYASNAKQKSQPYRQQQMYRCIARNECAPMKMCANQSLELSRHTKSKKSAGPGVFASIGSAISGLFGSNKSNMQPESDKSMPIMGFMSKDDNDDWQQEKCQKKDALRRKQPLSKSKNTNLSSPPPPPLAPQIDQLCLSVPQMSQIPQMPPQMPPQMLSQMPSQMCQESMPIQQEETFKADISTIINLQLPNGSWQQLKLIKDLAVAPEQMHKLAEEIGDSLVITHLITLWLKKHYTQKQYTLIIKKAVAWVNKTLKEKQITEDKLKTIQCI